MCLIKEVCIDRSVIARATPMSVKIPHEILRAGGPCFRGYKIPVLSYFRHAFESNTFFPAI
jgi:hypothetical protein